MSYESYAQEVYRRAVEAVEAQRVMVRRAQAILDRLAAEAELARIERDEESRNV